MNTYFLVIDGAFITGINNNSYDEDEIGEAFAKSLKEIREYSKMSLKSLSDKIKIPVPTLSAYENKTRIPSFVFAMKIAAFFGSTLEDFIANGLNEPTDSADIFIKYDYCNNKT